MGRWTTALSLSLLGILALTPSASAQPRPQIESRPAEEFWTDLAAIRKNADWVALATGEQSWAKVFQIPSETAGATLAELKELCPECIFSSSQAPVELKEMKLLGKQSPYALPGRRDYLFIPRGREDVIPKFKNICPPCSEVEPKPKGGVYFGGNPPRTTSGGSNPAAHSAKEGGAITRPLCAVPKSIEDAADSLFEALKRVYIRNGWSTDEILRNEPKGCARDAVLYKLSIARQVMGNLK